MVGTFQFVRISCGTQQVHVPLFIEAEGYALSSGYLDAGERKRLIQETASEFLDCSESELQYVLIDEAPVLGESVDFHLQASFFGEQGLQMRRAPHSRWIKPPCIQTERIDHLLGNWQLICVFEARNDGHGVLTLVLYLA